MSLYTRLEPLKIYSLGKSSLIDCELQAYETALKALDDSLNEIRAQAFVQTATGDGLLLHEKLVGLYERPSVSIENRRALVLYRRSVAPFDFNLSGMVNSILAVGLESEIVEDYESESLKVISKRLIDEFFDLDSVKQSLFTMLPAHLEATFDIGIMTWDMFDAIGMDWDRWDAAGFTWEEFDINAEKFLY